MNKQLQRKEVWLLPEVINLLQKEANDKKWSLKQYMEFVLTKKSDFFKNRGCSTISIKQSPKNKKQ